MECGNDVAVTFIVHFSRGDEISTTVRLNVIAAIAKGRTLIDEGWQVFITDSDDARYHPSDFDKLASSKHAAGRNTQRGNNT
jgi:hypothetical protein